MAVTYDGLIKVKLLLIFRLTSLFWGQESICLTFQGSKENFSLVPHQTSRISVGIDSSS